MNSLLGGPLSCWKKLKDKEDELESLVTAITTSGARPSKCVTIKKTLDGRLQIDKQKGYPHVIYARIWRWPSLHKKELHHAKFCQYAFDLKCDSVCINPYHYERVVSQGPSSGMVQNVIIGPPMVLDGSGKKDILVDIIQEEAQQTQQVSDIPVSSMEGPGVSYQNDFMEMQQPHSMSSSQDQQVWLGSASGTIQAPYIPLPSSHHMTPAAAINPMGEQQHHYSSFGPYPLMPPTLATLPRHSQNFPALSTPDFWCTIAYFEINTQVGESFKVSSSLPSVTVDGYVNPSRRDRFCSLSRTILQHTLHHGQ